MPAPNASPPAAPQLEGDPSDLLDWALLRDRTLFVLRAPRRHRLLAAAAFLAVAGLGASTLWLLPATYRVQVRILAQRNPVMATLSNPWFPRPYEGDAPTRAARETVLRRENLVSLIRQTNLVEEWIRTRAPAQRVRDRFQRLVTGRERTEDERLEAMVERLEKRLTVQVVDGTVTIALDWNDAETCYRVVETAMQNFLDERHTTEISIVGDAISVLQVHAANLQRKIDAAIGEIAALDKASPRPRAGAERPRALPPPAAPAAADPETLQLQALLQSKRRALADLEEFRRRRLKDLQDQLSQAQAIYADRHPAVLTAQHNIQAQSAPSPQIAALEEDVAQLERELHERGEPGAAPREPTARELAGRAQASAPLLVRDDPKLDFERGQLRQDLSKYSTLLDRIDSARVEMDTAQAAFKYRYSVITPPQLPKHPRRPRALLVAAGSLLGALAFALLAAVSADVRSGLVHERWQLERQLGLRVLAELR